MMRMDDTPDFYEGAEKLLEIWFEPSSPDKTGDMKWLRVIPRCSLLICCLTYSAFLYFLLHCICESFAVNLHLLAVTAMFVWHARFPILFPSYNQLQLYETR